LGASAIPDPLGDDKVVRTLLVGRANTASRISVGRTQPGRRKRRTVSDIGQLGCERTRPTEKEKVMASPTMFRTPYTHRLELVRDTIKTHSKLGDKAASDLAVHVLHALNSIPEKVR
jgi:Family of unknown function (DUF6307)